MQHTIRAALLFAWLALCGGCDSGSVRFVADGDALESEEESATDGERDTERAETADEKARDAEAEASDPEQEMDSEDDACAAPLPLRCGDRLAHSTLSQGRADRWQGYSCTQRYEGGREAIYAFETQTDCKVDLRLSGLSADLDLLVLSECSPWACRAAASTPQDLQHGTEALSVESLAGVKYFVVVDGYGEEQGSYTLDVACACQDGDAD